MIELTLNESEQRQLEMLASERSTTVLGLIRESVDRLLAEAAGQTGARRYGELVDRKFAGGLTQSERMELERLERELEAAEAAFYEPVVERLAGAVKRVERATSE